MVSLLQFLFACLNNKQYISLNTKITVRNNSSTKSLMTQSLSKPVSNSSSSSMEAKKASLVGNGSLIVNGNTNNNNSNYSFGQQQSSTNGLFRQSQRSNLYDKSKKNGSGNGQRNYKVTFPTI